ncbi:anthranilate synthase component 1 [Catalinimonas alkaloidigena]|uniref:Anthranilate synthase component 1 n=1 Tax=Catalinimonas alkaloidigena TaxID=1075417 RepID=A0A1G9IYP1_9BACT|nr:anthranilate synthase component I family protein [Catalinimonas alkaloidigena]SDL29954.1 anthranilate synthase component 1 [Catalinimonas alkaloidigena]
MNETSLATPHIHVRTRYRRLLADTMTPVSIFLKLRDRFVNTLLLESSDYHGHENAFSIICCQPLAGIEMHEKAVVQSFPDGRTIRTNVRERSQVLEALTEFQEAFKADTDLPSFLPNGLFGYIAYDAVQYFEDLELTQTLEEARYIPAFRYQFFRFLIAVDHFKNELYLVENTTDNEAFDDKGLEEVLSLISNKNIPSYHFKTAGPETSNFSDEAFLEAIGKGQQHCFRGDVFQIVLARRFATPFQGDEFNVYRTLRSINPSPYLFYFDYGSFRIFGSSPEAQITIKNGEAAIHPIAGTFLRTGNDAADAELARKLLDDPKENAEHVMLVDLARNDLSRNGDHVHVETFKEIQYYSHVIHLVSKVTARLTDTTRTLQLVADTFPAGTLSGAPKHRAMQLIDQYERGARGYYGGCIGFLGFDGSFNNAIMIRSFLSKDGVLYYQAGAGVVAKSNVESELQEVHNKLKALRTAIAEAEKI